MQGAPTPANEAARLAALRATRQLDSGPEARFDQIAHLARRLTAAPIALVSLIDERRVYFKTEVGAAKSGVDLGEPHREFWFCSYVVLASAPIVIEDTRLDPRFADHPLVTAQPGIRFYAGVPLRARGGELVGALAVLDVTPRSLSETELRALQELAKLAESELASLQAAMTDALTGVDNLRMFERIGAQLLGFTDSRNEPSCVLVADFNGIGMVNQLHGIEVGDQALRDAAHVLRQTVRASDLVARVATDEFAVLLISAPANSVARVIDRIQERARARNEVSDRPYVVSFGFGFAQHLPGDGASVGELIAAAERQMHDPRRRPGRT